MPDTPAKIEDLDLETLLALAARPMTPREIWQQRVSFAYGQMMDCAPGITREDVERKAEELYGPCPT